MASTKAIATIWTSRRPAPVLPARESRDEPRMKFDSQKNSAARKKAKSPTAAADLRPVIAERQSAMISRMG
jgi:hypothetical protein